MNDIYCDKLIKVVKSITNKEQAKSAFTYYKLWRQKYGEHWIAHNIGLTAVDMMACYYLSGFLSGLNQAKQ